MLDSKGKFRGKCTNCDACEEYEKFGDQDINIVFSVYDQADSDSEHNFVMNGNKIIQVPLKDVMCEVNLDFDISLKQFVLDLEELQCIKQFVKNRMQPKNRTVELRCQKLTEKVFQTDVIKTIV